MKEDFTPGPNPVEDAAVAMLDHGLVLSPLRVGGDGPCFTEDDDTLDGSRGDRDRRWRLYPGQAPHIALDVAKAVAEAERRACGHASPESTARVKNLRREISRVQGAAKKKAEHVNEPLLGIRDLRKLRPTCKRRVKMGLAYFDMVARAEALEHGIVETENVATAQPDTWTDVTHRELLIASALETEAHRLLRSSSFMRRGCEIEGCTDTLSPESTDLRQTAWAEFLSASSDTNFIESLRLAVGRAKDAARTVRFHDRVIHLLAEDDQGAFELHGLEISNDI